MTAHADDDYAVVAALDVNYCGYFADGYCLSPKWKSNSFVRLPKMCVCTFVYLG